MKSEISVNTVRLKENKGVSFFVVRGEGLQTFICWLIATSPIWALLAYGAARP